MIASLRAILAIAGLTVVALCLMPLQWLALKLDLPMQRWLPLIFHRCALVATGMRVHVRGAPAEHRPLLVTSNHVSWGDIIVLGSLMPLSFIAKSEVGRWPVFGTFARMQRSVFVDRQRRTSTGRTASEIGERLTAGDVMVLFAEGTSSDGNRVLPFRSALVGAVHHAMVGDGDAQETPGRDARVWAQPLSIVYSKLQGMPMGRQFRPLIAWYGDMDLAPHLWAILREGALDVEVVWGDPVPISADTDRKALTRALEARVRRDVLSVLTGRGPRHAAAYDSGTADTAMHAADRVVEPS
ncbi:1-acyl-sn-glycerol-3-phosphate acyltransferase [Breoghania sp. L-A4]|uniref:lysophospholipid acyltransferase family protein n=1 Tax=Breoghania sp. L-A4 TaxID=2304600 RepID=UPI000E35F93F|nr:1-acyl-sn-glycerol-3-phosphate acyltransferase [Breoghania sp. L-A4]AXS39000.1 1-acyl-sn-glycerol-3-phosphate acyltransferase [Breoghania sp. L-A4]